MRFLAVVALMLMTAGVAHAQKVKLDSVSIHLFLEKSGELSPDVSTGDFFAWNFGIDSKRIDPDEHFHAILIKVRLVAPGEEFEEGDVAELTLTNLKSKKVVKRERIAGVYVGAGGVAYWPVFVENAACGPFELVVAGGGTKIVKRLDAACGE